MKFLLNQKEISFSSREELAKAIPPEMLGKVLNYGQGEGQVEIESTVWGFYVNSSGIYYMAFEEGVIEWAQLDKVANAIVSILNQRFGVTIKLLVEGPFTNDFTT